MAVVVYDLVFHNQAYKDAKKLSLNAKLREDAEALLNIIKHDPYHTPPPYKYLSGNLSGLISRRINIQHRLVYQVLEDEKVVKIIRMWSHYE